MNAKPLPELSYYETMFNVTLCTDITLQMNILSERQTRIVSEMSDKVAAFLEIKLGLSQPKLQ
jgi:hypothetical protein